MGWVVLLVVLAVLIGGGVWMVRSLMEPPPEPIQETELTAEPTPAPQPPKPAPVKKPPAVKEAPPPEEPTPEPKPTKTPPVKKPPPVKQAPPPVEPEVVEEPSISPAQLLLDRQRAEAALTDYLGTKRELDELAVLEWGGDDYADILSLINDADLAFSAERFADAADGYQAAKYAGDQLAARADDAFDELLRKGQEALMTPDGAEAERKFAAALAIRPDAEDARNGLRRSVTIERTTELLKTGRGHEANRLYELALTDFDEAVRLDPLHEEARTASVKVREVLQEQTFKEAMSDALTALGDGRLNDARKRILQARALRPDSPAVRDALFQITEAERAVRIDAMGKEAKALAADEKWDAAHEKYRAVLAIDANVAFARVGAEQCAICIRSQKKMEHFVNQPELLAAPDGRATARLLVTEVNGLSLTAPNLKAQAAALSVLLIAAETPVPVSLQSDGFTRVDVYKVGRFPPFQSMPLELLPGTYTIVGHRAVFRDVRLKLEVRAGDDSLQATVQCRDRI